MIFLSSLRESDCEPLYEWLQHREYRMDSGGFTHVSWPEHRGWFERAQQGGGNSLVLAARAEEDERLVGMVQLVSINRVYSHAEMRIRMSPHELGKGFGTAALRELCAYGFHDLNLNRIYLQVRHSNERAIRCYEKVGFKREGLIREHYFVDGVYEDSVFMGLLRREFETSAGA